MIDIINISGTKTEQTTGVHNMQMWIKNVSNKNVQRTETEHLPELVIETYKDVNI